MVRSFRFYQQNYKNMNLKKYAILSILALVFLVTPTISRAQMADYRWCDFNYFPLDLYEGIIFENKEVVILQTTLKNLGFFTGEITSYFGPLTKLAVIAWQTSVGISNNGYFGAVSRAKMNEIFKCPGPSITLRYPNGGETLYIGDPIDTSWSSYNILINSVVDLTFKPISDTGSIVARYYNYGRYFHSLTPSAFQGLGAMKPGLYNLTISTTVNGQTFSDTSDAPFIISAQPSNSKINVLAPNGGEVWQLNNYHTIRWTPYDRTLGVNSADQVEAYLEKLINDRFVTVGRIIKGGIASFHWYGDLVGEFQQPVLVQPDPQYPPYYAYNPPPFFPPPGDYYVRTVSNTPAGQYWDRSDRLFTLVAPGTLWADLTINGSNGPITVPLGGAEYDVSWDSNTEGCVIYNETFWWDFPNLPPDGFFLDNLPPSGTRKITILPPGAPGRSMPSSMQLICSSARPIEGQAWDFVEVLSGGGVAGITDSPIITETKIVSPNDGENISWSSPQTIVWQVTSEIKDVSLALYKNDAFTGWIARSLPAQVKMYRFTPSKIIPSGEIGNNNFKIYLLARKINGGAIADKSDRPFSIVNEPIPQPVLQPIHAPPNNLTPLNNTNTNTNTATVPGQSQPQQTIVSSINYSNPPKGAIDARQVSDWNKVRLYFSPALPATEAVPSFFSIISANQTAPQINSIDNSSRGRAIDLNLNRAVLPGERILITHNPSNSSVCLGALPGDVNGDGRIMANDLSSLRASLAGEPNSLLPLYRTDINSDGVANVADDTSLVALLHARSTTSLNTLPACPESITAISTQAQLANALSSLNSALQTLKQAVAR